MQGIGGPYGQVNEFEVERTSASKKSAKDADRSACGRYRMDNARHERRPESGRGVKSPELEFELMSLTFVCMYFIVLFRSRVEGYYPRYCNVICPGGISMNSCIHSRRIISCAFIACRVCR